MRFNYRSRIIAHKRLIQYSVGAVVGIIALSIFGSYWTNFTNALRLVMVGIFIFFIPGWCATVLFLPYSDRMTEDGVQEGGRRSLDLIERITLAVILSIIISSAVIFALSAALGNEFTPRSLAITIVLVNFMLCAVVAWRKKWLSLAYVIPLMVLPIVIVILNLTGVAFTVRNIILEVIGLILVIATLWSVTKHWVSRPNK